MLSGRLNEIRRLRNRVFHYEPIWHRRDLGQSHDEIVETVGWLNQAAREVLVATDRFSQVYGEGPGPYRAALSHLVEGNDEPG